MISDLSKETSVTFSIMLGDPVLDWKQRMGGGKADLKYKISKFGDNILICVWQFIPVKQFLIMLVTVVMLNEHVWELLFLLHISTGHFTWVNSYCHGQTSYPISVKEIKVQKKGMIFPSLHCTLETKLGFEIRSLTLDSKFLSLLLHCCMC